METKERNMGKEKSTENEKLLNKREVLSDEALKEVAGGGGEQFDNPSLPGWCRCDHPDRDDPCLSLCCKSREDCER